MENKMDERISFKSYKEITTVYSVFETGMSSMYTFNGRLLGGNKDVYSNTHAGT